MHRLFGETDRKRPAIQKTNKLPLFELLMNSGTYMDKQECDACVLSYLVSVLQMLEGNSTLDLKKNPKNGNNGKWTAFILHFYSLVDLSKCSDTTSQIHPHIYTSL